MTEPLILTDEELEICVQRKVIVHDINALDGVEIRPGVTLISAPDYHRESGKWRCLANVGGCLALVELKITVVGEDKSA